MPITIIVPQLGESVVEGTISKWLKNVGDSVKEEEPLVEIMTDKITIEVPSPGTGTLAHAGTLSTPGRLTWFDPGMMGSEPLTVPAS